MKSVLILCGALWLPLGLHAEGETVPFSAAQIENLAIQLAPVQATQQVARGALPGRVVLPPAQMRAVSAPQAGQVSQVTVAEGDEVKAGQILARLHSQTLIDRQAEYLQALTRHHLAKQHYQRDKQLFDEGIIPERRYLSTQSEFSETRAEIDAHRQLLQLGGMSDAAIDKLAKTRQFNGALAIRAPAAGMVLSRQVVSGQRVDSLETLFRIADLSHLWLELRAPLERLAQLRPGTALAVKDSPAVGEIRLLGREVEAESQTVLVRAEITVHADSLRVGQFIEAQVDSRSEATLFAVPSSALARNGAETVVFLRNGDGFQVIPVEVIASHDGSAVLRAPLQAGAQVASSGVSAIKAAWQGIGGGE